MARLSAGGAVASAPRRAVLLAAAAAVVAPTLAAAAREDAPAAANVFIEVVPTNGQAPVRIAASQVVRVARADGHTVVDTTAWVQQRTTESVEAVARRLAAAGQRLVALTDLRDARTYLAADRVVLVREAYEQHAAGARATVVMVGLRFNTDIAVRETVDEVMAALGQDTAQRRNGPPADPAAARGATR